MLWFLPCHLDYACCSIQHTADVSVFKERSFIRVESAHVVSTTSLFYLLALTILLAIVAMQGGECRCGVNNSTLLLAGAYGSHARHCRGWLGAHTAGQEQCRVSFCSKTLP